MARGARGRDLPDFDGIMGKRDGGAYTRFNQLSPSDSC